MKVFSIVISSGKINKMCFGQMVMVLAKEPAYFLLLKWSLL